MNHPADEVLATLLDEHADAALREHVASCAACREQLEKLHRAARAVADVEGGPSVAPAVLERIERRPRRSAFVPAFAAAVAVSVVVVLPMATGDEMTARGAGGRATRLALVVDGAPASTDRPLSRTSSLRADLVHPGGDEPLVVVAVDATGGVHWLRPAFTDTQHPPACPTPPTPTELSVAPETVSFSLPPGLLVVHLLAVDGPCDVAALDTSLTADRPLAGVRTVDEVQLRVAP